MRIKFLIIAVIITFLYVSCKKDKDKNESTQSTAEKNVLVNNTECKHNVTRMNYESNQSCVEYAYDELSKQLNITHVDAGFNCCPGELACEISYNGDTIIFTETESKTECYCNCLYDLYIEVKNLAKDRYILKFVEPYAGNMEQLVFPINLNTQDTGSFCVSRADYPWGIHNF